MTLREFRKLVRQEFGGDLHRLTPDNARAFLDQVQGKVDPSPNHRIALNETERTYEGILRDFLARSLDLSPEQAVIRLWMHCLEVAVADVTEMEADKFEKLFAGLTAENEA